MTDVSSNWRRGHPWATVYDFFVEREELSRPLGRLLFGTDLELLYDGLREAIDAVPHGGRILDVPCGGGVALRGLEPEHSVRYMAADISRGMLDRTAHVAQERSLRQVQTVSADVEALPFGDGEFDLALSFAGLHCVPHPDRAVAEISRCLRGGGRFVGSLFATDGGVRYLPLLLGGRAIGMMGPSGSVPELYGWLERAGLEDIDIRRSGALAYFAARQPAAAGRARAA